MTRLYRLSATDTPEIEVESDRVMAKTVVVTGASSGIGRATAELFVREGWNVVATMRRPEDWTGLSGSERLKVVRLDVQDRASIDDAVAAAVSAFGTIDCWINNAGFGTFGPFEAATRDQIERQYEVNVFGLIACIQAVAPVMRANKAGTIVNVTSNGGLMAFPAYTLYNSTKFAVEGLSEGLWFELKPFGIRLKVVEPGVTKTDFGDRSMEVIDPARIPDYAGLMQILFAARKRIRSAPSTPEQVAHTILGAAKDPSDRLRYLSGADAKRLWRLRRWLGPQAQMRIVQRVFGL
jgi:NAD(P)-dependent dehydrogenase (short-subunit alcohol dehydrogenase family)